MLSNTSKMPGKSISLSAEKCITGSKLAKIKDTVCEDCYALKGAYRYPVVKKKMGERMGFFNASNFIPLMVMELNRTKSDYFRWFDSGDVQSVKMCLDILEVCDRTPNKKHWIPTKEHKFWKDALKTRALPDNVVLRFSAYMIDKAPSKNWQWSSAVVRDAKPFGYGCPAPEQGGKCKECRACWSKDVKTVSYHKH
tara:strand:+ start:111 stop:698 length:588 start_codon:yes stop_codon:yes gene_type:complete